MEEQAGCKRKIRGSIFPKYTDSGFMLRVGGKTMLTEAEREKVYHTRGFRNFCFRAGKANPHALLLRLRKILYLCFMCLIVFTIAKFKIAWFVKSAFFLSFLSILANYFWGVWLGIILYKHSIILQLLETKKQEEKAQKYLSEPFQELFQKIINGEILVIDLLDGFVLYQNENLIVLFYKGFFYDMDYYEKFKKVFFEPEIVMQQLNNNNNTSKE
ncbi:MAG: hypothetical protein HXM91_02060 [Oribacterium sinus]|uniref:Uncharacterized protein n=1 Tax=Oribacterium sinus TaxID=237576 RepID=A0A930DZY5_9FIRM|nr:hypothetical protein [Oribacterium sinus]